MIKPNLHVSDGIQCTKKIAHDFAKSLKQNCIIYLNGEVGSGKTIFTSKVADYFGIYAITSSSFSRIQFHNGTPNIIHCDLYRGNYSSNQFLEELEVYLKEPWILFIEWPDKIFSIENSSQYIVHISVNSLDVRTFSIEQVI